MSQLLKCKRNGCKKTFDESQNTEHSCHYHSGKPMFHDLKKGWTCCQKVVYDWDEFEKIPTCCVGAHTSVDPNENLSNQEQFFQSSTVQNAQKGIENFSQPQPVIKSINDYNKIEDEKKKLEEVKEKKPFITKNGLYKCSNKGCMKEYDPQNNPEGICNYHKGEPCFHDLAKYWTCCKKEVWDWDEFQKLPTCSTGRHEPKLV